MTDKSDNNLDLPACVGENEFSVENLSADDDLIMEKILDNMNNTPLGQVLKKIATLPEVRQKKVLNVRRQLTRGEYDINSRLDAALDKVLEKLIQ